MSDPQHHSDNPAPATPSVPPPAYPGSAPAAPAYNAPAYNAPAYADPAYAPAGYGGYGGYPAAPGAPIPGRTMGIVAFILSFFMQVVALVLGIIALVQSKKAGQKNGFALAAIIISIALMVIGVIIGIAVFAALWPMIQVCIDNGPGVWDVNGVEVSCG